MLIYENVNSTFQSQISDTKWHVIKDTINLLTKSSKLK